MADEGKKYEKKDYVYMAISGAVFLVLLAFLIGFCGHAQAAPIDESKMSKTESQSQHDAWENLCIPLTVGYLAGNPSFGTGLGYKFPKSGITLMGQIVETRIEGQRLNVPTGLVLPPLVQFESPERSETGFQFTVVIPFGD